MLSQSQTRVTEVTCPVTGRAQPELTSTKRHKTGHVYLCYDDNTCILRIYTVFPLSCIFMGFCTSLAVADKMDAIFQTIFLNVFLLNENI